VELLLLLPAAVERELPVGEQARTVVRLLQTEMGREEGGLFTRKRAGGLFTRILRGGPSRPTGELARRARRGFGGDGADSFLTYSRVGQEATGQETLTLEGLAAAAGASYET